MSVPPLQLGPAEWGVFVVANLVITYFCAGRLGDDVARWRAAVTGRDARDASGRRAEGAKE